MTNIEEYIYLLSENAEDPYDLTVVKYETITERESSHDEDKRLKDYYIMSRKGLCHYVNGKPIEFI